MSDKQYKQDHLGGLRRFAFAITVFNLLGHFWFGFEQSYAHPLASLATAYIVQLLLESLEAWAQHRRPGFTRGFIPCVNCLLSAHITGLACAMLLYANERLWVVCFATAVAITSKTLFRAPVGSAKGTAPLLILQVVLFLLVLQTSEATRIEGLWFLPLVLLLAIPVLTFLLPVGVPTRHYLNPSNFGIAVTLVLFTWVGIAAPYQYTEALDTVGDWLIPGLIICTGSLLNTVYTKRIPLILAWVGGFALQAIVRNSIFGTPVLAGLSAMTGVAFILFTFYMVTDPATTPDRPWAQVLFGGSVALMYAVLMMAHIVFGLFFALVIVCVGRGLGMFLLAFLKGQEAADATAPIPTPVRAEAAAP